MTSGFRGLEFIMMEGRDRDHILTDDHKAERMRTENHRNLLKSTRPNS